MDRNNIIRIKSIFRIIGGLPKSILLNFRCFPLSTAIRLPILVSRKVHLGGVHRNSIFLEASVIKCGMIKIGIVDGSEGIITEKTCYLGVEYGGKMIFKGNVDMAPGGTLKVSNGGILILGNGVSFNYHCTILCKKHIMVGENNLFGWNVLINDGDGHHIYDELNQSANLPRSIEIADNVWIASNVTILKGSCIGKCSIIGLGSIVTKKFEKSNVILAGNPARIVKEKVRWRH